ncbi:hypothetical protein bcere0023_52820 [Bacillus cereus Rock4-2]|nr:hypothetical protein bcere0023_52820 [Bacillus cereus Rock4-2]
MSSEILSSIRIPSFSFTINISASLKFSGAFSSGNSITSTFAYADNRFKYSAIPCFKYFSFNFPIEIIEIFTRILHLTNMLSTKLIHISTNTTHILCENLCSIQHMSPHFDKIHMFFSLFPSYPHC